MTKEMELGERNALKGLEQQIERGLQTFKEVGTALARIRDEKLYRQRYDTFEKYCQKRWNFTRRNAYFLIDESATASQIENNCSQDLNRSQARALSKVPEEKREEVIKQAKVANDGKLTAKAIQAVVNPPKPDEPIDGKVDVPDAMTLATEAINVLNKIPGADPDREKALTRVMNHINSCLAVAGETHSKGEEVSTINTKQEPDHSTLHG